jgi:cell division protein FtsW
VIAVARTDTSLLGRWWWTVDRWAVASVAALIAFGALLAMAASPAVAERVGLDSFYFVRRQFMFVPFGLAAIFAVSMLSPRGVKRICAIGFVAGAVLLAATLPFGTEIKGARRWIDVAFVSLQPSEFVKPTLAVMVAWALAAHRTEGFRAGSLVAVALFVLVAGLLALQPDIGMATVVTAMCFCQFFVAGLRLTWALAFVGTGFVALTAGYFAMPHVAQRIDRFLDPSSGDSYQINRSIEAFTNGGLLGRGPGEGRIKSVLPDAHADFVFSVAGEEFGLLVCLLLVGLFAVVVLRSCARLLQETNLFVLLAATGLLTQFGLQALINMGSALRLIPTKGMTLPFISYGGSSLLAVSLTVGLLLALTRRRFEVEIKP